MNEDGKRVSWVELYLDLIFVLAVGGLAHIIEAEPEMHDVWIALGLFVTLWWTWIGFAVLYNRRGADTRPDRLLFLAGSVPAGIAAIAIEPASEGHSAAFATAMAVTRVVLAVANDADRQIVRAYGASALLFVISIWVPEPWRYLQWAIAIGGESGAVLRDDREAKRQMRRDRDFSALGRVDPNERLDPHHFAERFGLFLIILLGEVVISTASAEVGDAASWGVLAAAMVLAAALWWLYFDAAAAINLKVLELSGGSPTMARAIFAAGHMLPAFSLILDRRRAGAAAGGRPADRRLLARLRRDRDLPRRHARLPGRARPLHRGHPGAPAARDVPARPAPPRAVAARVHLGADGLDGDVRGARHHRRGPDRAVQKLWPLTSTRPLAASQRTASCSACSAL